MKGESRFSSAAVPKEAGQSAASGLQAASRRKWQLRPFRQEGPPHIGRQSAKLVKERSKSKRKSKSKSRGERTPLSYPSCHAPLPMHPRCISGRGAVHVFGYITYFRSFISTLAHSTDEETNFFDGILDILCSSLETSLPVSRFSHALEVCYMIFPEKVKTRHVRAYH